MKKSIYKIIVLIIICVILCYFMYIIYLLVKQPTDIFTVEEGKLYLEESDVRIYYS